MLSVEKACIFKRRIHTFWRWSHTFQERAKCYEPYKWYKTRKQKEKYDYVYCNYCSNNSYFVEVISEKSKKVKSKTVKSSKRQKKQKSNDLSKGTYYYVLVYGCRKHVDVFILICVYFVIGKKDKKEFILAYMVAAQKVIKKQRVMRTQRVA